MIALYRSARVVGTVLVEAVTVIVLFGAGRRPELAVPVGHLGEWLRHGDPATVVVALLRWVALAGAGWLLVSTLLYLLAALGRVPAAMRAVRWSTVPAVRRAIDAACAVSVATSVVLAPTVAGAAPAGDPPAVTVVRDGRGDGRGEGGRIARLPAGTAPARELPPAPAPTSPVPSADVVVAPGDNLWVLAASHLAAATGRAPADLGDDEVARYWLRVCDLNRERLVSGDPGLVYPGEHVVLPPI
jgi:hypothetical protein